MTAVPEAVSNLQLRRTFWGHAVDVMSCIDTKSDPKVYVVDDEDAKISHFSDESAVESGCFIGFNADGKDLHLLSIDNALYKSVPGGIADCAVFHTDLFALVEFKAKAEGNTQESVEYTYEKAISQLENTLNLFRLKLHGIGIDLLAKTEVVCHVIVSPIFPRSSAMEMNYSFAFAMRNAVELSFDNTRDF